jgi:hypothetical protein
VVRGDRAAELSSQLDSITAGAESEPDVEELDTRLVLKLQGATRLQSGPLHGLQLTVLGEGRGWTYAVLSTRESRDLLAALITEYGQTEQDTPADWDYPQTWAALLDNIEGVSLYGRDDRYDRELDRLTFEQVEPLDVLLWPSPTPEAAQERISEIEDLVRAATDENLSIRVVATDPRPQTTVVRINADRDLLDTLLAAAWVERVRPPLRPEVTQADVLGAKMPVPMPEPRGAAVGVIDGIPVTANPLLLAAVTDMKPFPADHVFGGPDAHGTPVTATAVWGDLDFLVRPGMPTPDPHPVVNARVLDQDPNGLVVAGQAHVTIAEAMRWLVSEHQVRVINLSINRNVPADGLLVAELTATLDQMIRELDVVVVVSTGNRLQTPTNGWLVGYPGYLLDEDAGVAEPGDAALAVTVGGLAKRDVPGGRQAQSLVAIAPAGAPSPFTRSGPTRGHTSAGTLKPEFTHHGGNWAHDHQFDNVHQSDPGIAMITAIPPTGTRFLGMSTGTSYAAPAVAREAARIATRYPSASANLLRALLALSARPPTAGRLDGIDPLRLSAYGVPNADRILESGGPTAILTINAEMNTNSVVIHPVPIPYQFAEGTSRRLFRVALAFDPPVRRSRREYIAGNMSVELVRGLDEDHVARHYQIQPTRAQVEANPQLRRFDLPSGKQRPSLSPGQAALASNTLIRRDFDGGTWDPDDEHYFLVVTHTHSPWTQKQRNEYPKQRYALAVQLTDEGRTHLDLHNLARAELRTRIRLRRN